METIKFNYLTINMLSHRANLYIPLIAFILLSVTGFSQKLPPKPQLSDIRSFNQSNLLKLNLGMSRDSVVLGMGGVLTIQSWECNYYGCAWGRVKGKIVNNPYSRDLKQDKDGTPIEVLWYYTDIKSNDGAIRKDELSPIVLERQKLIGIGWGFFEDYSKRKELNLNVNN